MVKILVTGANGYIGSQVAKALRANGHVVYGLVRTQAHADELSKSEVIGVIGDHADVKTYQKYIDEAGIVIDNVLAFGSSDPFAPGRNLLAAVTEASKKAGQKKRFIYTSGCLVYKSSPEVVDESVPALSPYLGARAKYEQEVTGNKDVHGVVLRPAWVYGLSTPGPVGTWFEANANGDMEYFGNPEKVMSWVHVLDLADAYVRAAESATGLVAGEVFDVADDTRETGLRIREAFGRAGGAKGKVVLKPANTDFFSQAMEQTNILKADKIRRYLGWRPRHGSVLDDVAIYAAAHKAAKAAAPAAAAKH